jgi:hypothetical protein
MTVRYYRLPRIESATGVRWWHRSLRSTWACSDSTVDEPFLLDVRCWEVSSLRKNEASQQWRSLSSWADEVLRWSYCWDQTSDDAVVVRIEGIGKGKRLRSTREETLSLSLDRSQILSPRRSQKRQTLASSGMKRAFESVQCSTGEATKKNKTNIKNKTLSDLDSWFRKLLGKGSCYLLAYTTVYPFINYYYNEKCGSERKLQICRYF